ncbi:hypothetical protein G7046_g6427 [Stylonectria norvegica]|nr:hypothetical protein G7046_g6427 [Stylonectria norvegica]
MEVGEEQRSWAREPEEDGSCAASPNRQRAPPDLLRRVKDALKFSGRGLARASVAQRRRRNTQPDAFVFVNRSLLESPGNINTLTRLREQPPSPRLRPTRETTNQQQICPLRIEELDLNEYRLPLHCNPNLTAAPTPSPTHLVAYLAFIPPRAMSTPVKTTPVKAAPVPDSPGTWRHPRLNEITRRRNVTTFSEKNVRQIAYNVVALLGLWSAQLLARIYINPHILPNSSRSYLSWTWFFFQLIPFLNIGIACLPLVRPQDDLADIALTPAQRKLLGLPPASAAPIADATFSTPPRYSRTPSISGSVGSRGSYASSPLSGRGSPIVQGGSGSPLGSPLFSKSVNSFGNNGRRSSIGSGSPFNASTSANLFSDPTSPSPSGGKRTSVGLNSKWLYEKGRRSSGNAWLH